MENFLGASPEFGVGVFARSIGSLARDRMVLQIVEISANTRWPCLENPCGWPDALPPNLDLEKIHVHSSSTRWPASM